MPVNNNLSIDYSSSEKPHNVFYQTNAHSINFINETKELEKKEPKPKIPFPTKFILKMKSLYNTIKNKIKSIIYKILRKKEDGETHAEKRTSVKWEIEMKRNFRAKAQSDASVIFKEFLNGETSKKIIEQEEIYLGALTQFEKMKSYTSLTNIHRLKSKIDTEKGIIEFFFDEKKIQEASISETIKQTHINGMSLIENYYHLVIKNKEQITGKTVETRLGADEILEIVPDFFSCNKKLTDFLLACGFNHEEKALKIYDEIMGNDMVSAKAFSLTNIIAHFAFLHQTKAESENSWAWSGSFNSGSTLSSA